MPPSKLAQLCHAFVEALTAPWLCEEAAPTGAASASVAASATTTMNMRCFMYPSRLALLGAVRGSIRGRPGATKPYAMTGAIGTPASTLERGRVASAPPAGWGAYELVIARLRLAVVAARDGGYGFAVIGAGGRLVVCGL